MGVPTTAYGVVPPETGIVHQVNLEYLARVVFVGHDVEGAPAPGEQPGQRQEQAGQGNPLGGQDHNGPGQNRTGNRQPEPDVGPGQPGQGEGQWGELPPYVNFLKNRGSAPTTVPAKYRKYWEAYLKQKPGGATGNGGK